MSVSDQRQLWAFDNCQAYPLPDNRVLVRNPRSGRKAVLTPDVYGALNLCRQFKTLTEHARTIASSAPALAGQEAEIEQVLASVQRDGLLLNAQIYALELKPSAQAVMPTDKPVAAIISWERPEALTRCLESLRKNCELDNLAAIYIIDDSRTETVQARNRASTAAFAEYSSTPVRYMGAVEQGEFMQQLIRQLPALEPTIRFLIDRDRWEPYWTSGLARTVALLLSAGRRLLVLDDDILCEVFDPPERVRGASFADNNRDARFFADNESWQSYKATTGTDPLLRHLSCLGSRLSDALATLGVDQLGMDDLHGAELGFMESLQPDAAVLVTECGAFGDPGTARIDWLTGLGGKSLEALLASDNSVDLALNKRNCWIGRHQAQVQAHANMSQMTGLDNRKLLPPYIPIMRGEDRLFGHMVRFLHPGSVSIDQAWAVPHLPIPERTWGSDSGRYNVAHPFPEFSMSLVLEHMHECHSSNPLQRMAHMARLYEDLSRMDHATLSRHYQDRRLASQAEDYCHLTRVRETYPDAPAAWQEFLQDGLKRLGRELLEAPAEPALSGYPPELEGQELSAWWQTFWIQFAQALQSWPAIRLAARQLVDEGRLGR